MVSLDALVKDYKIDFDTLRDEPSPSPPAEAIRTGGKRRRAYENNEDEVTNSNDIPQQKDTNRNSNVNVNGNEKGVDKSILESAETYETVDDQNIYKTNIGKIKDKTKTNIRQNWDESKTKTKTQTKTTFSSEIVESVSNPLAKREHSVSNSLAEKETVSIPLAKPQHTVSNALAIPLAIPLARKSAKKLNPLAKREHSVSNLNVSMIVGNERKLVDLIYDNCQSNASLQTQKIISEDLKKSLEISESRLRNLIFRLTKKHVFTVIEIKPGRGGWRRFELDAETYKYLGNSLAKREHSVSKETTIALAKALAEPLANLSSSSSSLSFKDIKDTTTSLPEDWNFDLTPFMVFNFNKADLIMAFEKQSNLGIANADMVQESLLNYLWYHERNNFPKKQDNPWAVLKSALHKGNLYRCEERIAELEAQARVDRENLQKRKRAALELKVEAWAEGKDEKVIQGALSNHLFLEWKRVGTAHPDVMTALIDYYIYKVKE